MTSTPVLNYQSSLVMQQALVLQGVYPSQSGAGGAFLGQILTFAFGFAPGGTASDLGQTLPINLNQAVFSLLGTTYGGNGITNFLLPNLQGRTLVGTGQGSGLTFEILGEQSGAQTFTLTNAQLPADLAGSSATIDNREPSLGVTYMICAQGIYPSRDGGFGSRDMLGTVIPWSGNFIPADYLPCDGRLLSIAQNTALFSLLGTTYGGDGRTTFAVPDLRGRTIIGADLGPDPLGEVLGAETIRLTNTQAPPFSVPIDNRQPSLALNYLIALDGIFPSQGSGAPDQFTPFVGEIISFAGNFAPSGYALCAGQIMSIATNPALFVLIGTTYGGDGVTTFALPNLQGRNILGAGNLNGTPFTIGELLGGDATTLTLANLPALTATTPGAPTLTQDTGSSASDHLTKNGALTLGGIEPLATVEYSVDGLTWTLSFTPVQGVNHVQVRQTDVLRTSFRESSPSWERRRRS